MSISYIIAFFRHKIESDNSTLAMSIGEFRVGIYFHQRFSVGVFQLAQGYVQ